MTLRAIEVGGVDFLGKSLPVRLDDGRKGKARAEKRALWVYHGRRREARSPWHQGKEEACREFRRVVESRPEDWQAVVSAFDRIPKECGFNSSIISYGCLINLDVKIGKVAKALDISKEMESYGIKHNNKTYSMLISGFIHLHDFANAFSIFEEMLRSGLQPDRAIYNLLIEAFCKMGNMDRAIHILEKMKKERMQPSNRAFRPIIEGFTVAGDMKRALDTLDLMWRSGCAPTVVTYNALIHGLIRKHHVERAISVLDKMSIAGITHNHYERLCC